MSVPLFKADQEIDMNLFYAVLQVLPPRAAGGEGKIVLFGI